MAKHLKLRRPCPGADTRFAPTLLRAALALIFFLPLAVVQPSVAADYAPVVPGRAWEFPRDHGAHPEFKTEWWYFTGHLRSKDGRRFGFQWTVFRSALRPPGGPLPAGSSAWRAEQVFLGHLALSNLDKKSFIFEENAARSALGLAGAEPGRFKVWLPGFSAEDGEEGWQIRAEGRDLEILLRLTPSAEVLLHGDRGYSPKSQEVGRASYYYSLTKLSTSGLLRLQDQALEVNGEAWMDHEFGSGQLAETQGGWDWMGLPLGGKSALMVYRLRDRVDSARDYLSGTYVDAEGRAHRLAAGDIQLKPLEYWTSPRSGGKYPIVWQVALPAHRLELRVTAAFPDQELDTRKSTQVVYWEGSVAVRGKAGDQAIDSRGYLEMTGYAGDFDKKL